MSGFAVQWQPRSEPLRPVAAIAFGSAARALARRLLSGAELDGFHGVSGEGMLAILTTKEELPWADGVEYVGRDRAGAVLLLPTHSEPTVGSELFERALSQRLSEASAPWALCVERRLLIPLARALPIRRELLERWLAEGRDDSAP